MNQPAVWRGMKVAALAAAVSLAALGVALAQTLTVAVPANPAQPRDKQEAFYKGLAEEFKRTTGADLAVTTFSGGAEAISIIKAGVVSNVGPDVIQIGTLTTSMLPATGAFDVISPERWAEIGGIENFADYQLPSAGADGKYYAVPVTQNPHMYAYNTRMFEQAGIAKLPETWDELIAVAEKLTKPEQGVYGLALSYGDKFANTPMKVVTMFNAQLGGRWLSPDNKQLLLTSPQVLEAFHSYFDFITRYKILAPEAVTWTRSDALAAFASEKAAISIMVLPTGDPGLRGTPVDGHYAYAPMPLVPPGHATRPEGGVPFGSLIGGDNIAVPNWSKDKDLAWKYVALRTSPKWQFEYYKLGNELPIRNEVKDQIIALDPKAEVYYQAVAESKLIMFHPIWPEIDFLIADLAGRAAPQLLAGTFRNEQIDQGLAAALPELQASLARHNAGAN